ncbi:Aste57867_8418 [Aphanomyces stellatus]|uniref:Aste57867_8418 protein n=1 Tax=Aphanomyces stellatus TaxID=120398 RepID=A0A485KK65_9STRA|nr:hypothetical protein As57867_008386 [Aphanomyces stellatus]VFT85304.1 Aste57867_8418 [Aphanomyces stellatus]
MKAPSTGTLFLVSELTKHVCVNQNTSDQAPSTMSMMDEMELITSSEADLAPHFPPFVWLLRDFLLDIQENGVQLTPDEYLERSLQARDGTSKRVEERNRIRQSIRTLFTQRQCLTIIRPALDEDKLRNASTLSNDELRPEFVAQMAIIREKLFNVARPKRILNQVIDGPSGAIPDIRAAWDYVSKVTCETAYYHALEKYKEIIGSNTSMAQHDFERTYKEAQDAALVVFKKESVEGEARKICFQNLKQAIAQDRALQINALQQKSSEYCNAVLARLSHQLIKNPIENGEWDDAKGISLVNRLSVFFCAYDTDGDGPSKTKILVQFMKGDMLAILELLFVRMTNRHNSLMESTKNTADETIREGEKSRRLLEQECHKFQMETARLNGIVSTMEEKLDNAFANSNQMKSDFIQLQENFRIMEEKLHVLKEELDESKMHLALNLNDKAKLESLLEYSQQSLHQAIAEKDACHFNLRAQLTEERSERMKERENSISNIAKQAAELHSLKKTLKLRCTELEETLHQKELFTKEKDLLTIKVGHLLEVHEDISGQLKAMIESQDVISDEKERLEGRCERLEEQLGNMSVHAAVENVLEKCCFHVAKQFEVDKARTIISCRCF